MFVRLLGPNSRLNQSSTPLPAASWPLCTASSPSARPSSTRSWPFLRLSSAASPVASAEGGGESRRVMCSEGQSFFPLLHFSLSSFSNYCFLGPPVMCLDVLRYHLIALVGARASVTFRNRKRNNTIHQFHARTNSLILPLKYFRVLQTERHSAGPITLTGRAFLQAGCHPLPLCLVDKLAASPTYTGLENTSAKPGGNPRFDITERGNRPLDGR